MFDSIASDTAGQFALSRFGTTNTWDAQQIFKGSATTTPGAIFQAFGTTSAVPAIDANGIAIFQGAEATTSHVQFSASGATTHVVFRRNNGTYASPTALANGNVIGSLQWQGHGGSTFGTVPAAQIRGVTTQAFTEAARGTALEFYTTASGSITQQQTFVIDAALTYSLNALQGFASVRSNANAGTARNFRLATAASARWELIANATAESGSNAGSNFEIRRYSDAGADLGLIMAVTRSSGNITFNDGGGTSTFTNDIITPYVQVNRPAGNVRPILYRSSGSTRWAMQATATAESGSNAGSDWGLDAHTDAGAYNFTALSISRSGGNATFYNLVTAPQLRVSLSNPPASATATGSAGVIRWDADYIYVCTATDTWKRVAIATWV